MSDGEARSDARTLAEESLLELGKMDDAAFATRVREIISGPSQGHRDLASSICWTCWVEWETRMRAILAEKGDGA